MEKIVGMATIPERIGTLERVLDSLVRQVDVINLALNGFESIPEFLSKYPNINPILTSNEKGDANKFLLVGNYEKAFYFSCDDDIIYPPQYILTYMRAIRKYNSLVTIHGSNINGKVKSYYKGKQMKAHCLNKCHRVKVNIPGSGVSGFDTSQLKLKYEHFKQPNMADIFLGIQCQEQGVECMAIGHNSGWIKGGLNKGRATIYETHKNNDTPQTDLVNSITWQKVSTI